jgi:hypothetical protein
MRHAAMLTAIVTVNSAVLAVDLHVASTGSDTNPGTQGAPFATLTRARNAIREMRKGGGLPDGGVTVWIHRGTYYLNDSFTLTAEDGGSPDRPIVYRAVQGQEVRFVGGRELPATSFKPVGAVSDLEGSRSRSGSGTPPTATQAALDRIPAEARSHVLCIDLKALGISDYGEFPVAFQSPPSIPELFYNDQRMTLARWPNAGWATIARVIESGPAPWRNHSSDKAGTFEYEGDRPSRWAKAPAVWLEGYWCFDWRSETIKVKQIDAERRRITHGAQHSYGIGSGNPAPRRYYAVNLLEELDSPGEYIIDRQRGVLYFWPPRPVEGARVVLSTLKSPLIQLKDAGHVTFRDLIFEACEGTCVHVGGGREVRLLGCTVRNAGHDGIRIEGGQRHQVIACDIHDTGTIGLQISGGDRKTLTPCGHEAINNHIYRPSRRQRTYAGHIHIGGVGVQVAHNLMHDAPHMAIGLSGNDHAIEFNEVHHVGMECDDCGAFYMGRNPSERGTVLRYNFWHDVGSTLAHGSCAIYFDDGSGGQTVLGNVFYHAAGGNFGAVFVHGGHDNTVSNNIFVECKRAIGHVPWNDGLWTQWVKDSLWQERLLKEVDITRPPYIDRYPELKEFTTNPTGRTRLNHASRNVAFRCNDFIKGNWEQKDNLITDADPGFINAGVMDFRLRDDSVVLQKVPGFEKIPFDRIGLYRDEFRPELPPRR